MRAEVMEHFGLTIPFNQAGYYETTHHKELMKDVRGAVMEGRLIAVCGVVGAGKTELLRKLHRSLDDDKKIIVSKSGAVEKSAIKLATLVAALFYDLSTDKKVMIPKQGEARDRALRRRGARPERAHPHRPEAPHGTGRGCGRPLVRCSRGPPQTAQRFAQADNGGDRLPH